LALLTLPQTFPKLINFGTAILAMSAAIALLYYGRAFFVAIIVSAICACILDPAVELVMKFRIPRSGATPIVIGFAFIVLYLLGLLVWSQGAKLAEDLPTFATRGNEIVSKLNTQLDGLEERTVRTVFPASIRQQQVEIQQKPQEAMKARRRRAVQGKTPAPEPPSVPTGPVVQEVRIHQDAQPILSRLYLYAEPYLDVLLMASFVPFLVYFMLSWRDRIGESVQGLFLGERRFLVGETWSGVAHLTRAYVLGNFVLWLILSVLSAAVFFLLGVPYWALAGPLSGFFSLMPYVGLPLSVVPPLLATLAVPNKFKIVLTATLFAAALHVVGANFLYAKVVGRRVRLNPLVVTVALMFWATLWGPVGLLLAVPLTAAIKTVCDNVDGLRGYGRLLGDSER
jgi:predicted PurR-regulated permease PerM